LLAYSLTGLSDLSAHAAAFADPTFSIPLGLASAAEKLLPAFFPEAARYGFRVRVRPTSRVGKYTGPGGQVATAKERDAYLAALSKDGQKGVPTRESVYRAWLARHLEFGGAVPDTAALTQFSLSRVLRRDRSPGSTRPRIIEGPDAVLTGTLRVMDSMRFAELLCRGVGRHRAFGFGMLLLRPAQG